MRFSIKNIKATLSIAMLLLMITSTFPILTTAPANAQAASTQSTSGSLPSGVTANFTVVTVAYMSIRPNPIGLNQPFMVNLFPVPAPNAERVFKDLKVTITKPDGNTEVIIKNSYPADGTAWFEHSADQVGTWSFKFDFPGEYFPAGRYLNGQIITATTGGTVYTDSVYFQPSTSPVMNITVQQDLVASYPSMPLPTDYWTRPVPYDYREWWPIAGNFPWRGPSGGPMWDSLYPNTNPYWGGYQISGMGGPWRGTFTPWVQGPSSAHVAWKQQYGIGGIVGGDYGTEIADVTIFAGSGVGRFPTIVYSGRAYTYNGYDSYAAKDVSQPGTGKTAVPYWICQDYRTGELIWQRPLETGEVAPTVIEYFNQGLLPGGEVAGVAQHLTSVNFLSISGGFLRKYDPWTGAMVGNYSIAPMTGTNIYYMNGYCMGLQDLGVSVSADQRYRLINWTTFGTSNTFSTRIASNITWPWSSFPEITDYQSGVSILTSKVFIGGAPYKTNVMAASLSTGKQIWNVSLDEWEYSSSTDYADHGMFAMLAEQGYFVALNINTGAVVWKSQKMQYPWDDPGFGGYNVLSAYGLLYRNGYGGVYAFNWTNGNIAWTYVSKAAAPYETPYTDQNGTTVYSTNVGGAIADGKYYFYNTEHSASVPITRGWQTHCVNATSGQEIWSIGIAGGGSKHTTDIGAIADGYMALGGSDGFTYVFGKGQTETTVTAPDVVISKGSGVVIKGSVMDLSPAQPNTPCVSKDSMALQMEHIHNQLPIDGIWHNQTMIGVPVVLTAIDPNGNAVEIGTASTNGYYGTYAKEWTPDIEGTYQIIASFQGDDSYSSSAAATGISVAALQTAIPTPATTSALQVDNTPILYAIAAAAIAIIIAVVIVGVLILRRR